jgi:hypothetical protein
MDSKVTVEGLYEGLPSESNMNNVEILHMLADRIMDLARRADSSVMAEPGYGKIREVEKARQGLESKSEVQVIYVPVVHTTEFKKVWGYRRLRRMI